MSLEFQHDGVLGLEEVLQEIRFVVPGGASEAGDLSVHFLKEEIERCSSNLAGNLSLTAPDKLVLRIEGVMVECPKGRHDFEFFETVLKVHGKTQTYTINYTSMKRIFMVTLPDNKTILFLIGLAAPLKYGKQHIRVLVLSMETEKDTIIETKVAELLKLQDVKDQAYHKASVWTLMGNALKHFSGLTVVAPASGFQELTPDKISAVRCTHKTSPVFMVFAMKSMMVVPRPVEWIRYDAIEGVEFIANSLRRIAFSLKIVQTDGKVFELEQIDFKYFSALLDWFNKDSKVKISNREYAEKLRADAKTRSMPVVAAAGDQGRGTRAASRGSTRPAAGVGSNVRKAVAPLDEDDDGDEDDDEDFNGDSDDDDDGSEDEASEEVPVSKRPRR